jgi:hypothetical protein
MARKRAFPIVVACAACLAHLFAAGRAAAQVTPPPYRIILRSRGGEVVPQNNKDAQTVGGYIEVSQRQPDLVLVIMRGAVVAGAETHKSGAAEMHFVLDQDFQIAPTRAGLRQPRLVLSGQLIGALMSSRPEGGTAEQGPACAAVNSAGQPLVHVCVKPHAVGASQKLFVNDVAGPCEAVVVPGGYCLHGSFDLAASAPSIKTWCPKVVPAAAAVFTPEPRFVPRWNYVLAPFAAVPAKDFGFVIQLRVAEESPNPAPGVEALPPPVRDEGAGLLPDARRADE